MSPVENDGGKIAGNARKEIEEASGRPVITEKNATQLKEVVTGMIEGIVNETEREKSMIIIGAKSYTIDTKKMPIFYPAGKKFHFIFTENDCEEIKSGRCPIEDNDVTCDCLCNGIKNWLNERDYVQDGNFIEVIHYQGNDIYEVNNGQHRMCIAGKLKAGIKVLREESNQDCAELGIGCTKEF